MSRGHIQPAHGPQDSSLSHLELEVVLLEEGRVFASPLQ